MNDDDLRSTKEGFALVVASLVDVLTEEEPTFRFRYLSRLAVAYNRMLDTLPGDQQGAVDVVGRTRDLVSGISRGLTPEARFLANAADEAPAANEFTSPSWTG